MWWVLLGLACAGRLDLNTATVTQLQELRGIGPTKAASIVLWRRQRGACSVPEEVQDAPGIGPGTWRAIRDQVVCGPDDGPRADEPMLHPPPPARRPDAVDINHASVGELLGLAGMTPERAGRVVSDREARGSFASCRDVERIPGFGPATVAVWGDRCTTTP